MSALGYTKLFTLESDSKVNMSPDEQICYLVSKIKGVIRPNWQVIAPTPNKRVIYFELSDGINELTFVQGYQEYLREMGEKKTKNK